MSDVVAAAKPPLWRAFPYLHEAVLALLVIGVFVYAGIVEPRFVQPATQLNLAGDAWPLALLALPMALIIITGGIDLSVGAATALCAIVIGISLRAGLPMPAAIGLSLLVGTTAGAINGMLIALLRVHPLIVTLATMNAFRGIALAIAGGNAIGGFPPGWRTIAGGAFLGIPGPLWFIGTLAIFAAVFLGRTSWGRFVYAIGHNATAARYSGVPVRMMRFWLFTLSGLCAGIAAVLITSRYNIAKADAANALELQVITAVVLGGVSIFGGRGNIVGVALGVVLIHVCQKFVIWHWNRSELNALVVGGLLIGSVLVNSLVTRKRSHR